MALRFYPAAREDIKVALKWSAENFGKGAAARYQKLLAVAFSEIEVNPLLAHSYEIRELQPGIRFYHLRHSRRRAVVDGKIVKKPRHFIIYTTDRGGISVLRVLHDRMEAQRYLGETE